MKLRLVIDIFSVFIDEGRRHYCS